MGIMMQHVDPIVDTLHVSHFAWTRTRGFRFLVDILCRTTTGRFRYVDLTGRPVEPVIKYFPEGPEKEALDCTGDFPQTGARIPLFGESCEVRTLPLLLSNV